MTVSELDVAFTEKFTPTEEKVVGAGGTAFLLPDDSPEQPQGFYPVQTKSFQGCFGFNCNRCHLSYAIAPARVFHCKTWELRPVLVESKPAADPTPVRIPNMASPTLRDRVRAFVVRFI
jgi:hypothetical protein